MNQPLQVAVIYNLPSKRASQRRFIATDVDTQESAEEIWQVLIDRGATVAMHPVSEDNIELLTKIRADLLFNLLEWDGLDLEFTVKAIKILENSHIPFTGSGSEVLALTGDKLLQKKVLKENNLPTAFWQEFKTGTEKIDTNLKYPVIVKPSLENCSIGLDAGSVVQNATSLLEVVHKKLNEFKQPLLVEEFIAGREYQVTVYEKNGEIIVLPPAEIDFYSHNPNEFLTFESRWEETHPDYKKSGIKIADISEIELDKIVKTAKKTYQVLQFGDYTRLDIRSRGEELFILEANANPGLGDDEEYGMTVSYKAVGMSFSDFVWAIVDSCLRRFGKSV